MTSVLERIAAQDARGTPSEHSFATSDGTRLFYRAWLPREKVSRAVVLFHRGHEHSGRWDDFVREVCLPGTAFFAWDARGHGRSPGERGYAEHFSTFVKDADEFVRHVSREHGIALPDTAVIAHSVGAVIAAAWVHDYAPPVRAMVLATPALRVKLYVPFALPMLRVGWAAGFSRFVKSYVKAKMLTHDPQEARRYAQDPLISRQIAVNVLLEMHDTATRLIADAGAIRVPTLVLTAGSDWVVKNGAARRFLRKLSSPVKKLVHLDGFHHAVFHESNRARVVTEVRKFLTDAFERPRGLPPLLDAHRSGFTKEEYDRLKRPRSMLSPGRASFAVQRLQMRTTGRLSRGICIGRDMGFDSGRSLDYVYGNRAQGITPLGRMIDRIYLNAIGWRGIRVRKQHLQQMLWRAVELTAADGRTVHVVDIASGPGRYLLELLRDLPTQSAIATLRDRNLQELKRGEQLAAELGVTNARFLEGDAFSYDSLTTIAPKADVAIVSGLYELFGDNEIVLTSLRGLATSMRADGYLIYTNQPWHPQVEMIARVLKNRDGKPWVMRRRTQEEMDDLVRAAGFVKLDMLIDPFGIFTVSLAHFGTDANDYAPAHVHGIEG